MAKQVLVLVLGIDLKYFGVLVLVLGIDFGPLEVLVLVLTFYKLVLLTSVLHPFPVNYMMLYSASSSMAVISLVRWKSLHLIITISTYRNYFVYLSCTLPKIMSVAFVYTISIRHALCLVTYKVDYSIHLCQHNNGGPKYYL